MGSDRGWLRPLLIAALALGLAACSRWQHGLDTVLAYQARKAVDAGELARADELLVLLRTRLPRDSSYAVSHAQVLAQLNDPDGALAALEQAAALGERSVRKLEQDASFAAFATEPRFVAVLDTVRANAAEFEARYAAALEPRDPGTAASFPDLAALLAARKRAEEQLGYGDQPEPYAIRQARFREEWIAALARLAGERRGTPDREGALIEIVRMRLDDFPSIDLLWTASEQVRVSEAASAYLAAFPQGEHAREAQLAVVVAVAAAARPPDFDWGNDDPPRPDCAAALPLFEELDDDGTADKWSAAALGFKTLCLYETRPEETAAIRAGASAYLATPEVNEGRTPYDWMLRRQLTILGWRIDGPPPFEAEGLDGQRVSLADFRGKVTLLDFWSPG
jgi:hypothetical protein